MAHGTKFPESPTNGSVVETSLDYFTKVMSRLVHNKTVVTCDQAIYNFAKNYPDKYADLILRLGGIQITEKFMGQLVIS